MDLNGRIDIQYLEQLTSPLTTFVPTPRLVKWARSRKVIRSWSLHSLQAGIDYPETQMKVVRIRMAGRF